MIQESAGHRLFFKANELEGVSTRNGMFKVRNQLSPSCKKPNMTREEKRTEVNMTTRHFKLVVEEGTTEHQLSQVSILSSLRSKP